MDPDAWVTAEIEFLRRIELGVRGLAWQNSEQGSKGVNQPKPIALTQAERDEEAAELAEHAGPIPDRLDLDELRKRIPMQRGGA